MDSRDQPTEDRSELLLNYQNITGVDDLETCRLMMERADWDLSRAVMEHFNDSPLRSRSADVSPVSHASESVRRRIPGTPPPERRNSASERAPRLTIRPSSHVVYTGNPAPAAELSTFDWIKATISLPFRFVFTSLFDIFKFVWSFVYGPTFAPNTPVQDVENFINDFETGFGPDHPIFYRGSYRDAYNDAKREIKFLVLYLHQHDQVDSNRFCSDTLTNPKVIALVNARSLFWACSTKYAEGHKVAQALNSMRFPALGLIASKAGQMTLVGRLQGYHSPQELIERLEQLFRSNDGHLAAARNERQQLDMTQTLRKEQDDAYQKSLRADQDKERKKLEERERIAEEERIAKENADRILREQKTKEETLANRKSVAVSSLPAEPTDDSGDICRTSIKLPTNRRLERRFLRSNTTQDLYNFVLSQPEISDAFEIYTSYPRKRIDCRSEVTLAALGFGKTETFLVEEVEESDDELELNTAVPAVV